MNEEQLKFLYENYASDKGFSDYNEFKDLMSKDQPRKMFYEESNKDLGFKSYDDFNLTLGLVSDSLKKKEPTQQKTPRAKSLQGEASQSGLDIQEKMASTSITGAYQPRTVSGTEYQGDTQSLDSSVLKRYKDFKNFVTVSDEEVANIDKEVRDQVNGDDAELGFFDKLKVKYNMVRSDIEGEFESLEGFLPEADTPYNYLDDELKEAEQILKRENEGSLPQNFTKEIQDLAIELKKQKKQSQLVSQKRREYMNSIPSEERELLEDFGGNKLISENNRLSDLVSSKNMLEKSFQTEMKQYSDNMANLMEGMKPLIKEIQNTTDQATRDRLRQQYEAKVQEIEGLREEALQNGYSIDTAEGGFKITLTDQMQQHYDIIVDEIYETEEDLGTLEEEVDLFSRSHNAFFTASARAASATLNIVKGAFDVQRMFDEYVLEPVVGKIPYVNEAFNMRKAAYDGLSNRIGKLTSKVDDSVQERFEFTEADSFDDYFTYTFSTLGELAPYVGLSPTGLGAGSALIGATSTGNKYAEIKQEMAEGADYNGWQVVGGSIAAGVPEGILGFGYTARILKNSARISKAASTTAKRQGFFQSSKRVFGSMATEGVTEGATQVMVNFDDRFVLGKENVGILDNVTDPTIAGLLGGGFLPSFGAIGGKVIQPALQGLERKLLSRNADEIIQIERQMMSNKLSDESIGVLKKQYDKLLKKNKETLEKGADRYKKMSVKEFNVVKEAEKEVSLLRETAQKIAKNPELSNSVKKSSIAELKAQAKNRLSEKQRILKDLDKRTVEETPAETYDKVDSNYSVGEVIDTNEFNNVPEVFQGKKLTVKEKTSDKISMVTDDGDNFVLRKQKQTTPKIEAPITSEVKANIVSDLIGRPVTLEKFGDFDLDSPMDGDLYVEGQTLVFENQEGNIMELGSVNELSSKSLEEAGIVQIESNVKVDAEGKIRYNDNVLVPNKKGIKTNKKGDINRVVLRNEQGDKTVTLRGANAEEAAYQILLAEAQTKSQIDRVNKELENNEKFRDELRKAEEATETETSKDTSRDINEAEQEVETVFVEDKTGNQTRYAKIEGNEAAFIEAKDIPKDAPVKKRGSLTDSESRVYNDSQSQMFEAAPEADDSFARLSKDQAKTLKKVRKNSGKTFVADNGSLEKALSLDVEQLDDSQKEAYAEFIENVNDSEFNQLESKQDIEKFAEVYENETIDPIEIDDETETKEDKVLDEEYVSKVKSAIEDVEPSKIKDFDFEDASLLMSLTDDEIRSLTTGEAKDIIRSMSYIGNGFNDTSKTKGIIYRIKMNRNADSVSETLKGKEFKTLLRDKIPVYIKKLNKQGISNKDKIKYLERYLTEIPLGDIDMVIKGKKGDEIFRGLGFEDNASNYSRYRSKSQSKTVKRLERLGSKLGSKGSKKRIQGDAAILLTLLSETYQKNKPRTKGIYHPAEHLATLKAKAESDKDYRKEYDNVVIAWKSLPKRDDGTVNVEEAVNSFDDVQREIYEITNEHNNGEGKEVAKRIAAIEGERPIIYDHYVALHRRPDSKADFGSVVEDAKSFANKGRGGYEPKFSAINEREAMSLEALSFDFTDNFIRNYKASYKSLYMRPSLIVASKTFNKLLKGKDALDQDTAIMVKAAKKMMDNVVTSTFLAESTLGDNFVDHIINFVRKTGYFRALASLPRAGLELLSNVNHAMFFKPKELGVGLTELNKISRDDLVYLIEVLGSNQGERLLHTTGSARQELNTTKSFTSFSKWADQFNNSVLEKPDKWVAKPLWTGSLFRTFQEITGERLQPEKLKDSDYFFKNREALMEARRKADDNLAQASATFNPFTGVFASNLAGVTNNKLLRQFDVYMTRFQKSEFSSLVKSYEGLRGLNNMQKREAGALMAATLIRMGMYQAGRVFVQDYIINSAAGMLGFEEEEKQEIWDIVKVQGISSVMNAIIMRRLGNIQKVGLATGLESLNVVYGADIGIREDAENYGYDDSLFYSILRRDEKGNLDISKFGTYGALIKILGPYSFAANSSINVLDAATKSSRLEFLGIESSSASLSTQNKYNKRFDEEIGNLATSILPMPVPRDMHKLISYILGKETASSNPKKIKRILKDLESKGLKPNNKGFLRPAEEQDKLFMSTEEAESLFDE